MGKPTPKRSKLRTAFRAAALGLIGIHFGSYALLTGEAEHSDDVAAMLNISREQMRDYAQSRFRIVNTADRATRIFSSLPFSPNLVENRDRHDGLYAAALQDPVLGYNSFIDRATFGLSGAATPCLVVFTHNATIEDIKGFGTNFDNSFVRHLPGTREDYLKIILLHELEHCRHVTSGEPPFMQEYRSDQRALQTYLAQGGNPEVVRSMIYKRAISGLEYLLFAPAGERATYPYAMALALEDQFLLRKSSFASAEALRSQKAAYDEAAMLVRRAFGDSQAALFVLTSPAVLYQVTSSMARQADLKPEVRRVFELHKRSYEFFMHGPAATPATAPAPRTS